jgi:hypothetical protein
MKNRKSGIAGFFWRRSRNRPHQNVRECARRIGGNTWRLYKEADRARRGLEPLT